MSLEKNKALVGRYYHELWNKWNFEEIDHLIGEAIVFRGSLGISVQGRDGFRQYVETVRKVFPDFHNKIDMLIAENDTVAARLTYTGTHRGELFGIQPTGRPITYAGVGIFRIAAGIIVEGWVLGDTFGLMRQLGVDLQSDGVPHDNRT